jgi:hypothetical protein
MKLRTTTILAACALMYATIGVYAQVPMQGMGDRVCPPTITAKLGNTPNVPITRTSLGSRGGKLTCVYQTPNMVTVQTTATQCRNVPVTDMSGPLTNIMKLSRNPSVSYQGATPAGGTCKVKPIIRYIQK